MERRGVLFSIDPDSLRHVIKVGGRRSLVWLENLQRDVAGDGDIGRIARFVDAVLDSLAESDSSLSADRLFWSLEPNDYVEGAEFRVALSDRADRTLVSVSADKRLITWVTRGMLDALGLDEVAAAEKAFMNQARALQEAEIRIKEIDGVGLGLIGSAVPFKAALLLAPNLREVFGTKLGWPLLAVVPDRDFIYLWAAEHSDFVRRVGGVVVREYLSASYRISTEVYEVSDEGIRAIGEFPAK